MTSEERLKNSGAFNLGKTVLVGEGEGCHGFSVHKSCCQRRMIDLFSHYHWGNDEKKINYTCTAEKV